MCTRLPTRTVLFNARALPQRIMSSLVVSSTCTACASVAPCMYGPTVLTGGVSSSCAPTCHACRLTQCKGLCNVKPIATKEGKPIHTKSNKQTKVIERKCPQNNPTLRPKATNRPTASISYMSVSTCLHSRCCFHNLLIHCGIGAAPLTAA